MEVDIAEDEYVEESIKANRTTEASTADKGPTPSRPSPWNYIPLESSSDDDDKTMKKFDDVFDELVAFSKETCARRKLKRKQHSVINEAPNSNKTKQADDDDFSMTNLLDDDDKEDEDFTPPRKLPVFTKIAQKEGISKKQITDTGRLENTNTGKLAPIKRQKAESKKLNEDEDDFANAFKCPKCGCNYSRKDNLKRHMWNTHQLKYADQSSLETRTICSFQYCDKSFYHKNAYIAHLMEVHNVETRSEILKFPSEGAFECWKENEELVNHVYFSRQRGDVTGKVFRTSYYNCQYDGHGKPHRKNDEPVRKTSKRFRKGLVKTGSFCPARMVVKVNINDKSTEVTYIKSHNHPVSIANTVHHPIPKSVKAEINTKLAMGVPVKDVYKEIRMSYANRSERSSNNDGELTKAQLVTKSNISDIKRKLNYGRRLHPDDSTSLYLLVKKLEKEKYNVITLYKPQGEKALIGPKMLDDIDIKQDIFAIGIQTKEQQEMFEKHASKVVCIDATHKTNQYEFPLVTVLVADEFNKGYPVAHLISNRTDELLLRPFFQTLHDRSPNVDIGVVMTDDDNSGWNAFTAVFGGGKHFLCKWHIKRAWKNKIPIVGHPELQVEVYKCLEELIEEKSEEKFQELLNGFFEKYQDKCSAFVNYFRTYYSKRVEKWAMCHRNFPHANTDTNMFAEAFHNKLKTYYMDRKPNKRVDDLINLLLTIEEDDYWRRRRELIYYTPADVLPAMEELSRHKKGLQIPDIDFEEVNETEWMVKSQKKSDDLIFYKIQQTAEACTSSLCEDKCHNISCTGLCEHLYVCNCDDRVPMCKHVHKVHSVLRRKLVRFETNEENPFFQQMEEEPQLHHTTKSESMIKENRNNDYIKFKENVTELDELMENDIIRRIQLSTVNNKLQDMILQCRALLSIESANDIEMSSMKQGKKIQPNEKLELQWRPKKFTRTKKVAKKHASGKQPSLKKELPTETPGIEEDQNNKTLIKTKPVTIVKKSNHKHSRPLKYLQKKRIVDDISIKDLTKTLISHGPHNLSLMSILTLELFLTKKELAQIKKIQHNFKKGWLSDEVIGSYMFCLQQKNEKILYCDPTVALAISQSRSVKLLWSKEDIDLKELVFVPFNATGNHWVLLVLNVIDSTMCIIDLMANKTVVIDKRAIQIGKELLSKKFRRHNATVIPSPDHSLQQDGYNCGVMVCFYATMLSSGGSLTTSLDANEFRCTIYETIVSNCLKTKMNNFYDFYNICKICGNSDIGKDDWVQCTRCPQWFHCTCVNISVEQADSDKDFSCPS